MTYGDGMEIAWLETDFLDNVVLYSLARTKKHIPMGMDPVFPGVRQSEDIYEAQNRAKKVTLKKKSQLDFPGQVNLTDKTQTHQSPPQPSNRNFSHIIGQAVVPDLFCALIVLANP